MIHLGYTLAALLAVVVAVVVDLLLLRTKVLRSKLFWATWAIVVFFQLIVNGILTGLDIVQYDPRVFLGVRLAYAPIEDLGFGFALVTLTITLWAWWELRAGAGSRLPARRAEDRAAGS